MKLFCRKRGGGVSRKKDVDLQIEPLQDKAIAEPVCRLLETTLRSTHLPSRMGALHGVLYVLECDLLDDTAKQLIPAVSEYLLSNLRAIAQ